MLSTRQIRMAVVGSLLLLICTAGVGWAEGENPSPPDSGTPVTVTTVTLEQSPQSANTNTDAIADPSDSPEAGNTAETGSLPESSPEPEPWRAVVNSLRPGYWEPSILPAQGLAMYYNPGVFQQVLDFRYTHNHISKCDDCIGYAALLRGGDIDRQVWLQREGQMLEGPFWVVDAAALKHVPGLLSRNWVVDVDHDTAMRWRMAGPIPITVYDADSPEAQAAAEAQRSAAQTVALVGIGYKCASVPLETHDYQLLGALSDSVNCLISHQSSPVDGSVDAGTTDD